MGIVQISDPSGQYEAVIFEEGLAQYRDMLEPGQSVLILAGADLRPEGVSIRIQSVESLEKQASREITNLRIYLRDDQPLKHLAPMLGQSARERADGRISFVIVRDGGAQEVEIELRDRYSVSHQVARAIKAVPGVLEVELV
jgi:DNA polymerase-3 subunit alpha